MNHISTKLIVAMTITCLCAGGMTLAAKGDKKKNRDKKNKNEPVEVESAPSQITCAVLDFEVSQPNNKDMGSQIAEALTALLSGQEHYALVDRSQMAKVLEEQELNLSGLVDARHAVKVGKLVGAKIIVTGKAFSLGDKLLITAKLIGTETTLVESVMVRGALDSPLDQMVVDLSDEIIKRMDKANRLLPKGMAPKDPLPDLIAKVKALKDKPTVAIIIPEQHVSQRRTGANIDPAVETEIMIILRKAGFKVVDTKHNQLSTWAQRQVKGQEAKWPDPLSGADAIIIGEGMSEYSTSIGKLISCSSRVEVRMIQRKDRTVLFNDRATTRAADISEQIAGKTALQKAGRLIATNLLRSHLESVSPKKD